MLLLVFFLSFIFVYFIFSADNYRTIVFILRLEKQNFLYEYERANGAYEQKRKRENEKESQWKTADAAFSRKEGKKNNNTNIGMHCSLNSYNKNVLEKYSMNFLPSLIFSRVIDATRFSLSLSLCSSVKFKHRKTL